MSVIPDLRRDELETHYLVRLARYVERDDLRRSPEVRELIPVSSAALWLRVMRTACPRWRRERIQRMARRMYRRSTWYLRPWQLAIDVVCCAVVYRGLHA